MEKTTYDSLFTVHGPSHLSPEKGFTLIELLITVAIMSTLFAIAVPSLLAVRPAWNSNSAAKSIIWDMQLARVKAISKNRKYRISFGSPSANQYSIQEDTNNNNTWDATTTDLIIKTVNLPSGIQFGVTGGIAGPNGTIPDASDGISWNGNYVTFMPSGSAIEGTVYLIPMEDKASGRTDRIRAVRVRYGTTANIKAYRYDGSAWSDF